MTLTRQEQECARGAVFDLASGYPQVALPRYLVEAIRRPTHTSVATTNLFGVLGAGSGLLHEGLNDALLQFLGPGAGGAELDLHVTYSGSAAITRTLVACQRLAENTGLQGLEVVLLSPCIDIYSLFASELKGVEIVRIDCVGDVSTPNVEEVLNCAQSSAAMGMLRVFLIASPENPTGYIWSYEDLVALVAACNEHRHCLILDHAFLMAGVQARTPTAMWDLDTKGLLGCALWDTGKTFGLNGEKLGFIFSTPVMTAYIEEALSVLQFSVSSYQQSVFAEVLREAKLRGYVNSLTETCRKNLSVLSSLLNCTGCAVTKPPGASFALVNIENIFESDARARQLLLKEGVGVVTASTFFHNAVLPRSWIRFALARDESIFAKALHSVQTVFERAQRS